MDRKTACITQAAVCRKNAKTDPEHQEYWIDETIKWLERAIGRSGGVAVSYEVIDGRLVSNDAPLGQRNQPTTIAESFDTRTLANMEVALERACKALTSGAEEHPARRHIASKILECAESGDKTLGRLTEAGLAAATELTSMHGA
jgi:hypothetical protein